MIHMSKPKNQNPKEEPKKQTTPQSEFSVEDILSEVARWEGSEESSEADSPFVNLVNAARPSEQPPRQERPAPEEAASAADQEEAPPAETKKSTPPLQESVAPELVQNPRRQHAAEQPQEFGHLTLLPSLQPEEQPAPDEATPAQRESPAEEQASAESPEEAHTGEESAIPSDNPQDAGDPGTQEEEDERDNLVPFLTPKEPETIRELVSFLIQKVKIWQHLRHDKVAKPVIRLDDVHIPTPKLPDLPAPEDTAAQSLARGYSKGLARLRMEAVCSLLLAVLLLLLAAANQLSSMPFLQPLLEGDLLIKISLGGFALVALLSHRVLTEGVRGILKLRMGMETPALFATICVLADGISMLALDFREVSLPLFAPVALVLSFQMLGIFWRRDALRVTCRTAARAKDPDVLVREPQQYDGQSVYRRRTEEAQGFGSQIQQEDVSQKTFRYLVPLLCLAALGLCLWATVGHGRKDLVFWALSAGFAAVSTLSGTQCFGLPFHGLAIRLSKLGAALAGWTGAQGAHRGTYVLLEDGDLFPPGAVELTSFRSFHEFGSEIVITVTASLLREVGSGLDLLFENLIRMGEGSYVATTDVELENDGITGTVLGETVLVGNADFLERMGVALPNGVRVAAGVMTAIGGRFAGQFVLDYSMHKTPHHDMDALLLSRITPILTAVDFNLVPNVLRRQFRFPWDSIIFPDLLRRSKLATAPRAKERTLMAVLSIEGLPSLSAAIVGARRLYTAVNTCLTFTCLGSIVGLLLVLYLSLAAAVTAMSALSLSVFLILWYVPVGLISGWVNQF